MTRELAYINPKMLVWARLKSGREPTSVAAAAKISVERYLAWESGEQQPTLAKMREIARLLKRPLALFYLSEPPQGFSPIHDYRVLPGAPPAPMSPGLLLAIRRAHFRRVIAIELADELQDAAATPAINFPCDGVAAEEFAKRLREWLGVSFQEQRSWRDRYQAKQVWQEKIESRGILVFQAEGVSTREMRGFCISERPLPIIVTNCTDHPNARIFTMLHELCHVLQAHGGVCTAADLDPEDVDEVFCNQVAGETLVPSALLESVISPTGPEDWSDQELTRLSNIFSVSREVILRRLLHLGKTTAAFYKSRREQFIREFEAQRARQPAPDDFRRDMAQLAKSNHGPSFVRLVLSALRTDVITSRDASDYLGLKSKHLDRLEELVWQ